MKNVHRFFFQLHSVEKEKNKKVSINRCVLCRHDVHRETAREKERQRDRKRDRERKRESESRRE